jgi:hypothetical protein
MGQRRAPDKRIRQGDRVPRGLTRRAGPRVAGRACRIEGQNTVGKSLGEEAFEEVLEPGPALPVRKPREPIADLGDD